MPQSLSIVYIHTIFSTKDRAPLLKDKKLRLELHSFLGGVSKSLDCPPIIVGGVEDHVHILCRFGRTITQADWIKELKRVSNSWVGQRVHNFGWQSGYAGFSVSQSNVEQVTKYISKQEEHHHKRTFQEELRELLSKHEQTWDEKYLWD